MKKLISSLALFLTVGIVQAAGTGLINVQFSGTETELNGATVPAINPPQSGAALVGAAGDLWNNYAASALSGQALFDSSGAATGASLSFVSQGAYTSQLSYMAFAGQPTQNLMGGYLWTYNDPAIRMTVSGLDVGKKYDLYIYTQGDNNSAGREIAFSVNGGVTQTSVQTNASSFILNDNYLHFLVTADSAGVIDIVQQGMVAEGNVNGFQLMAAVPEPETFAMLLAGLAIVSLRMRRRPA